MDESRWDQLIDDALRGYAGEPPAGLDQRVLARVRRRAAWPWVVAAGVAAAVVVAMLAPMGRVSEVPPPARVAWAPAAPEVKAPELKIRVTARRKPARLGAEAVRPERVLAAFAKAHPELVSEVLVEASRRMAEPLVVEPLAIAPITIDPLAAGNGFE